MSKTHLTVGIAASLAITAPTTLGKIFSAVIGGCIGGAICDIECRSTPTMRDALHGRSIAAGITCTLLLADKILNTGIWNSILSQEKSSLILGTIVLLATCLKGRFSGHRTFTHSLLYVSLVCFGCFCITPELKIPVLAGGISHLVIDTFNRKPVPWLYPMIKKGICLKLCYANKLGNSIMMWAGLAASIALLAWRIMVIAGKA